MRFIFFSALALTLFSCSNPKPAASANHSDLRELSWLTGSWIQRSDMGTFNESWTFLSDTILEGSGFLVVKNDTMFSEDILIKARGKDIYYIVAASGQNDEAPVEFKLVSKTNGDFVFENPAHDFPQRIIYKRPDGDTLHAYIEGIAEGKPQREDFVMERVKK